jgi:hypothetical protein
MYFPQHQRRFKPLKKKSEPLGVNWWNPYRPGNESPIDPHFPLYCHGIRSHFKNKGKMAFLSPLCYYHFEKPKIKTGK